jgi:hypothetical protein
VSNRWEAPPRPQEFGPGHYEARLVAWTEGEEPEDEVLRSTVDLIREDHGRDPGRTLAEMRSEFGGDDGFVTGPQLSGRFAVSLAPWREADPDLTRLMPSFRWVADDPEAFTQAWNAHLKRRSEGPETSS